MVNTPQIPDDLIQVAAKRFGVPSMVLSFAVPLVIGVASTVYQNVTRFDKGYKAAQDAMREGTLELDGVVVEILSRADKDALKAYGELQAAEEGYKASQSETIANLAGIIANHANNNQGRRNDPPPPSDFGSMPLPPHYSVRLDNISRQRDNAGSADNRDAINDRPVLAGYPTANTASQ